MHPQNLFIDYISEMYPNLKKMKRQEFESLFADNLISPFNVQIQKNTINEIKNIISGFYELRENENYQKLFQSEINKNNIINPGNKSMMMSFDFHLDENSNPRLIEINTNAAFLGLGTLLYQQKNLPAPVENFSVRSIKEMILNEMKLNQNTIPNQIAIIDESPSQQRLYIEFLLFKEMFESFGWKTEILDCYENLDRRFNFVYNRTTDFYLSDDRLLNLKQKFNSKQICLSPNPYEYLLLADKQRLIDWSSDAFFNNLHISEKATTSIKRSILKTYELNTTNQNEIWNGRKNLFFKPKNAFGSKQSYKGQSISRKTYEELVLQNCVAQEYVAAPEVLLKTENGEQKFKYDLRAYAYQDQLQLIIARIYQGQVTNLRTPNGGFACVEVI